MNNQLLNYAIDTNNPNGYKRVVNFLADTEYKRVIYSIIYPHRYGILLQKYRHEAGFKNIPTFVEALQQFTGLEKSASQISVIESGVKLPTIDIFCAVNLFLFGDLFNTPLTNELINGTSEDVEGKPKLCILPNDLEKENFVVPSGFQCCYAFEKKEITEKFKPADGDRVIAFISKSKRDLFVECDPEHRCRVQRSNYPHEWDSLFETARRDEWERFKTLHPEETYYEIQCNTPEDAQKMWKMIEDGTYFSYLEEDTKRGKQ